MKNFLPIEYKKNEILKINHSYLVEQFADYTKIFKELEVDTKVHYPTPIHLQPAAKYLKYKKGDFPIAEKMAKTTLSLPVHEFIKTKHIQICSRFN